MREVTSHDAASAEALLNSALGIAYDGDGDRAIFADAEGKIVDGDAVMLLCAKQLKREGRLRGNAMPFCKLSKSIKSSAAD